MEIGSKLKECRTAAGLSQEALAQKLGITRQTVSSWEKNRSYPDIGSLAAHWGAAWVGLILGLIGIVILPPLWIARWKFFGMPKDEMVKSLTGWGLCVAAPFLPALEGFGTIASGVMTISGLLLILHNGICLEKNTRFWLIIALSVGVPIYIFFSGMAANLDDQGAFSQAQPFGSDYRIVEVEYGQVPESMPTLELSMLGNSLLIDSENVGNFTYIEPREDQTVKGIWQLVPENEPNGLYKLEVSAEDKTTLAYFMDDQLQWRWEIAPVPTAQLLMRFRGTTTIGMIDWYPAGTWSGDSHDIGYLSVNGGESVSILFGGSGPNTLTVKEEYHWGDAMETTEIQLQKNRSGAYPFPDKLTKRYEDGEQYAIYSFEWEGGVFLLRLNFE